MKYIFRTLIISTLALLAVSCVDELVRTDESGLVEKHYTVTIGTDADAATETYSKPAPTAETQSAPVTGTNPASAVETKSTLGDDLSPVWEAGESVSVYDPVANTSRIFTVESVDGSSAVITGSISAGDFPFSAVYPASAVESWTSITEPSISIPETQKITGDRSIDPSVLISRAYSETGDDIVFHNSVSLLKFQPGHDETFEIAFNLKKGGVSNKYVVNCPQGFSTDSWYYLAVAPGSYTGGILVKNMTGTGECYSLSSVNTLEAETGGILSLGTLSGGERSVEYQILSEGSFSNLNSYLDVVPLFKNLTDNSKTLIQLMAMMYLPWRNDAVKTIVYTHNAFGPDGSPVTLSAIMYVPATALDKSKTLYGMVIANHGTITSDAERPTNTHGAESIAAWKGYAVVLSDYCGFGADAAHPQAYLNPDVTARGSFAAYNAAMQILKDMGVTPGDKLYNLGYSQGGYNGMANIRYLSQHPELSLKFTKSFLGGGPYDIVQTWNDYMEGSYDKALAFVPLTLCSFNETLNLGLPYDRMFKEPLLSNYNSWILSKKNSFASISTLLNTSDLHDIIADELFAGSNEVNTAIMSVCERFSLTSGWTPAAGNVIRIYHSTQDDIVPYSNFTSIKKFMDENASGCTVTYTDGANGDHSNAAVSWATDVVINW